MPIKIPDSITISDHAYKVDFSIFNKLQILILKFFPAWFYQYLFLILLLYIFNRITKLSSPLFSNKYFETMIILGMELNNLFVCINLSKPCFQCYLQRLWLWDVFWTIYTWMKCGCRYSVLVNILSLIRFFDKYITCLSNTT